MGNTASVLFAVLTAGCGCCHATVVADPVNLAAGKPYVLSAKPNYRACTNDDGRKKLTDGTLAQNPSKLFWLLQTTVGWIGPSIVKVDLGKTEDIGGFFWHGAFRHGSGVNAPESVAVYVSEDGADWTYGGDLLMKTREKGVDPVAGREAVFTLDSKDMPCRGRYVLFVPAQSPMIFVDEVGVWSGDAKAVEAAWPKLERGVDPKKHVASVRLRARIFRDVTAIGEKAPDGLLERIRSMRCDSGLAGLRTELPLNAVHEEAWALNARRLRAAGFEKPVLWKNNRWDNLDALAVPARESTAFGRIEVEMMRNETRAETVNVLNPTDRALDCELEIAGLPEEAHVDCLEVLFTDTSAGVPVSGALKPGAGRRVSFTVPAGTSRQIWISFARPKGRAGTYDGKVVVRTGGEKLEAALRLVLHNLDFPDRPRLHTGGWDYLDGDGNYFKAAGSRASSLRLMKEEMYADTAWATAGVQPKGAKFGEDGALLNADALDFSRWDDWVERIWPEARVFAVFANPGEVLGRDLKPGDPRYDRRAETYFRAWAEHARRQGIGRGMRPFVLHLVDEPHTTNDVERFLRAVRPVAKVRDISVFCTPSFNKGVMKDVPQEFFDLCEVVCPGVLNMTENGYHADFRRRAGKGGEMWVYSCHGARMFDPIRYHRVQSWYAFQIGAKGSFFWAYGCGGGIGDSWHAYAQKSIEYSPFFISPSGGAMRSKQSEGIREGAEDYELLMMARKKGMPPERLAALVRKAMSQDPSGRDDFTRTGLTDWNAAQDRESMDRSRLELLRFLSTNWRGDRPRM